MDHKGNILIVGGAGYIGSHIVKLLAKLGYNCTIFDNLSTGNKEAVLDQRLVVGDLLNKNELDDLFAQNNFDVVFHFAALSIVPESFTRAVAYYQNNVVGTYNLLETMLKYNVKKIIFSSTCATYGDPQYIPMDEKHPQNPINPYGRTKLIIEQMLNDFHHSNDLSFIALRYFNAAGASLDGLIGEDRRVETHIIPLLLQAIKNDTTFKLFGNDYKTTDGTCIRDYIHVEDLAEAHYLAMQKLDQYCGFINIGTGRGTSVQEMITMAERVTNKKAHVQLQPRRQGDPAILCADHKLATEILGWIPQHDLEIIISSAWNWEQRKWSLKG